MVSWKFASGSRLLFDSNKAVKDWLKELDTYEINEKRECADAFFGAGLGNGSNLPLDDLLTKNPEV